MGQIRVHVAAITAVVATTALARGDVLAPEGLASGDTYHLAFVTEGVRYPTSPDIADYNAFVQAEAERPGAITANFGVDWFAIGSTATVNAKDNAIVEGLVYLLDGLTMVAGGLETIWDKRFSWSRRAGRRGGCISRYTDVALRAILDDWVLRKPVDTGFVAGVVDETPGEAGNDSLTGGSGSDWFIASSDDEIADVKKRQRDVVTRLS